MQRVAVKLALCYMNSTRPAKNGHVRTQAYFPIREIVVFDGITGVFQCYFSNRIKKKVVAPQRFIL